MCFPAQSADTDVINLILVDVPDIDLRNAEQDFLPLMVAGLTGKEHAGNGLWGEENCNLYRQR